MPPMMYTFFLSSRPAHNATKALRPFYFLSSRFSLPFAKRTPGRVVEGSWQYSNQTLLDEIPQ
jgi:hypothetical protein